MSQQTTRANAFGVSSAAKVPKGKLKCKTESQKLVGANEARVVLNVSNIGSADVWLCLGEEAAVAEEGPYLKKEGGSQLIDYYSGEIRAISKEGEPLLTYAEV